MNTKHCVRCGRFIGKKLCWCPKRWKPHKWKATKWKSHKFKSIYETGGL